MFYLGMEKMQFVCRVPGKCMDCGSVFDMGFDFSAREYEGFPEEKALDVCWACRDK